MTYPLALYRAGTGRASFKWDGVQTEMLAVGDADAHEEASGEGWLDAEAYLAAPVPPLIYRTAKEIAAALPELTLGELDQLKCEEMEGKARKGVLADIDEAIDAKLKA